ncbi:MAG: Ig-like domain-containing protein, partial [Candidatus Cloacimonetes bacterium]|nr:Ig-like domain-containing protein [Candidatus Cloacimonadota bacterium]
MRKVSKLFLLALLILIVVGCGNRKGPTGGPVDEEKPEILAVSPENYQPLPDDGKLEIVFSKPIDRVTLMTGIQVYPSLSNRKFSWLNSNTCVLSLRDKTEPNKNYFISFTQDIKGTHGNKLAQDYTYIYHTGVLQEHRISGSI